MIVLNALFTGKPCSFHHPLVSCSESPSLSVVPLSSLHAAVAMMSAKSPHQYPPSIQTMRHVEFPHHDHEREPLPSRGRNGGIFDGSMSPVTVKDFQDEHRGPQRRPSTPNLDRSSPRARPGTAPPVPDSHPHYKYHPPRNE